MSDTRALRAVESMCYDVLEAGNPNHFPAIAVRMEFATNILNTIHAEHKKTCSQILVGKPRPCSIHGERCFREGRMLP